MKRRTNFASRLRAKSLAHGRHAQWGMRFALAPAAHGVELR